MEKLDKLEQIFVLQQKFDTRLAEERGLDYSCQALWLQKGVLAIVAELGELLDELNYKWWKEPKEIDQEAVKEELVDILHFFVSMCIKAGISAEDLYLGYMAKNLENHRRQDGLSREGYAVEKLAHEVGEQIG